MTRICIKIQKYFQKCWRLERLNRNYNRNIRIEWNNLSTTKSNRIHNVLRNNFIKINGEEIWVKEMHFGGGTGICWITEYSRIHEHLILVLE